MTKRFFITGVDGFIGSWLDQKLRAQGHEVFGLSRKTEGPFRLPGDITDRSALDAALRGSRPDCIFTSRPKTTSGDPTKTREKLSPSMSKAHLTCWNRRGS